MSDTREWWVRCDNLIRVSQVPPGETSWECVYLERDYDAVVAERDRLVDAVNEYLELCLHHRDEFGIRSRRHKSIVVLRSTVESIGREHRRQADGINP